MRGFAPITSATKTELMLDFERSQTARPVLLWSTLVGGAASILATLAAADLSWGSNTHSPGISLVIVAPIVVCMGIGQGIYRLLVRAPARGARVEG